MPLMSTDTVRDLSNAEWDFISIDSKLGDLASLLHRCSSDAPECVGACLEATRLRYALRALLMRLDGVICDAVQRYEYLDAPPF